jgi:hypothetical protein
MPHPLLEPGDDDREWESSPRQPRRQCWLSAQSPTKAELGIQACFGSGHEAEVVPRLRFFDVTHPRYPVLLSHWDLPQGTIGCHEIDAVQRADGKVLAVWAAASG